MKNQRTLFLIYFKPLSLKGTNDSEDIVAAYASGRSNGRFLAEENQFSHIQTAAQKNRVVTNRCCVIITLTVDSTYC